MKEELIALVIETVQDLYPDIGPSNGEWNGDTPLFGAEGILDSLGLVTVLTAVEQAIEDRYDVLLVLADEKAFSQKNSPFRTVNSLAEYTSQLLQPQR